jgi:shikimate kinase
MAKVGNPIGSEDGLQLQGDRPAGTHPGAGAVSLPDRTIVIVGLMGAGKSCIGRRLAARIGRPFVDADAEVEAAAGCTIAEIFERLGEPAFREGERRVMTRLLDGPPSVLAAGGGAFVDADTRRLIAARSISVWLRADLEVLVKRTSGRSHRPLLNGGDPRTVLRDLMDRRYPIYAEADIVVDTVDQPPDTMVDEVLAALAARFAHATVA